MKMAEKNDHELKPRVAISYLEYLRLTEQAKQLQSLKKNSSNVKCQCLENSEGKGNSDLRLPVAEPGEQVETIPKALDINGENGEGSKNENIIENKKEDIIEDKNEDQDEDDEGESPWYFIGDLV